jgi:hypothetical protein
VAMIMPIVAGDLEMRIRHGFNAEAEAGVV